MNEDKVYKTPLEDLRKSALKHYEEVSSAACHWNSFVVSAIKAYSPEALAEAADDAIISVEQYGELHTSTHEKWQTLKQQL